MAMDSKKLKERVLDTSLLSGNLDVDDYATALLAQHSLEHATKETQRLEKEVEALKKENRELKHQVSILDGGVTPSKSAVPGPVVEEASDRKRKFPAVAALIESRANAQHALEPLARLQSRATFEAAPSDPMNLWYADTFSDELKVLQTVGHRIAASEADLPTPREQELEHEVSRLRQEVSEKKHLLDAMGAEREEWREEKEAMIQEMETLVSERDQLNDIRIAYESDLIKVGSERDDFHRMTEELDLKARSFQELNKTLSQKLSSMEDALKVESARVMRAYNHIFRLQQTSRRRHIFSSWLELSGETRKLARANAFRQDRLLAQSFEAWRSYVIDTRFVHGVQQKIARRISTFLFHEWARFARETAKKKRAATLFAKVKDGQRVRDLFRTWRNIAKIMAVSSAENDSNVNLEALRAAAAKNKVPAIMYAAGRGMTDAVLKLINEGGAVNMKERGSGRTPLHAAAEAGSVSVVEILLENGANPATTDDAEETPLQKAVKRGPTASVDVALALLRHGADPAYIAQKDGRSLLHIAVDANVPVQYITVLLQYKASVGQQQPATGRTALHAAALKGEYPILEVIVKSLLDKSDWNPDLFPLDINMHSPLHLACSSDSPDMPKCVAGLVSARFDPNAKSQSSETPLHIFCKNKNAHPSALKAFPTGIELDEQDLNGNTPLHYACELNLRGVALELVAIGASLYIVNDDVKCPLDLVPPGFAIELLAALRTPPIIKRAERILRVVTKCMICGSNDVSGTFLVRRPDYCRRCGRLCCSKCLSQKVTLTWPNVAPGITVPILGSSLEKVPILGTPIDRVPIIGGQSKVCKHCFICVMDNLETEAPVDNV